MLGFAITDAVQMGVVQTAVVQMGVVQTAVVQMDPIKTNLDLSAFLLQIAHGFCKQGVERKYRPDT